MKFRQEEVTYPFHLIISCVAMAYYLILSLKQQFVGLFKVRVQTNDNSHSSFKLFKLKEARKQMDKL